MKNLYHKNKGKVYPSPASSSSSSSAAAAAAAVNPPPSSSSFPPSKDAFSVLNLLPITILALVSVLSLQDQEVLAYLITRSMKTTNPFSMDEEKKRCKKTNSTHKPPIFDCGCFDCYTSYWFRWDSSPNRELIHQAIEAFEEHLTNGELSKKKNGKGGKKKDKTGRRGNEKSFNSKQEKNDTRTEEEKNKNKKKKSSSFVSVLVLPTEASVLEKNIKADDLPVDASDFKSEDMGSEESREQVQQQQKKQLDEVLSELKQTVEEEEEEEAVQLPASLNRGLVRKVLPDVLGLFNSRLWSLWNPTV